MPRRNQNCLLDITKTPTKEDLTMNTKEYQRSRDVLLSEIEEKQKALEALERVYTHNVIQMEGKKTSGAKSNGQHDASTNRSIGKGELLTAVKKWIGKQDGRKFTTPQLIAGLQADGFDAKIGSAKSVVTRLIKKRFLKIIVKNAGRRASVYRTS